jgi:hypothetical protein
MLAPVAKAKLEATSAADEKSSGKRHSKPSKHA